MKTLILLICFLILFLSLLVGEVNNPLKLREPEQYGVFFINQLPPEYVEDYYLLYVERLYYDEDNARLNIYFLEKALIAPFRYPSKALCLLPTKDSEKKYQQLLKMHFYLKIMQNYLYIGALYDKKNIYYFHKDFKKDLVKSLNYAKFYYNYAQNYWKKVVETANQANMINEKVNIEFLENELYLILNRETEVDWDYDYTINLHLSTLNDNLKKLAD